MKACGKSATGYTAAINQLAFGSGPGSGVGDACGRCFALTGSADPYSPAVSTTLTARISWEEGCLLRVVVYGAISLYCGEGDGLGACMLQIATRACSVTWWRNSARSLETKSGAARRSLTRITSMGKRSSKPALQVVALRQVVLNTVHSFDICEDTGGSNAFFPSGEYPPPAEAPDRLICCRSWRIDRDVPRGIMLAVVWIRRRVIVEWRVP